MKKCPDIDSIFDHIVKVGPPVIEKESIASFITDLISLKLIENKKTSIGPGSFYIKLSLEKKSELDMHLTNTFIIPVSFALLPRNVNKSNKLFH